MHHLKKVRIVNKKRKQNQIIILRECIETHFTKKVIVKST